MFMRHFASRHLLRLSRQAPPCPGWVQVVSLLWPGEGRTVGRASTATATACATARTPPMWAPQAPVWAGLWTTWSQLSLSRDSSNFCLQTQLLPPNPKTSPPAALPALSPWSPRCSLLAPFSVGRWECQCRGRRGGRRWRWRRAPPTCPPAGTPISITSPSSTLLQTAWQERDRQEEWWTRREASLREDCDSSLTRENLFSSNVHSRNKPVSPQMSQIVGKNSEDLGIENAPLAVWQICAEIRFHLKIKQMMAALSAFSTRRSAQICKNKAARQSLNICALLRDGLVCHPLP